LTLALAGWTLMPAVVLIALGGLATPSVRAMVSGRGEANTQGEMQGVLAAVEGLTAVFAPLVTAGLFYAFTNHAVPLTFPGAPFALAALSAMVAGLLLHKLA
jgi:DHA1 family tetracycline resistance protein-like MFS transporter